MATKNARILVYSDLLPGAAPIYDKDGDSQPVFNWETRRWVEQTWGLPLDIADPTDKKSRPKFNRLTYAPLIVKDNWKTLAAAISDGYLELIKYYLEGELLISYCENWILVGKNLNSKRDGVRAALTFFPKGRQASLREIRRMPRKELGRVPDWFPMPYLDKGSAAIMAVMGG